MILYFNAAALCVQLSDDLKLFQKARSRDFQFMLPLCPRYRYDTCRTVSIRLYRFFIYSPQSDTYSSLSINTMMWTSPLAFESVFLFTAVRKNRESGRKSGKLIRRCTRRNTWSPLSEAWGHFQCYRGIVSGPYCFKGRSFLKPFILYIFLAIKAS